MNHIAFCVNNVAVFIMLVIPGYLAARKKIITSEHIDGISTIIVNFLWPAMVINVMSSVKATSALKKAALLTGMICIIIYLFCGIFFLWYWKKRNAGDSLAGILTFCSTSNNTGFIGMPFISAFLGTDALFIASIAEAVNDLIIFTLGVLLIQYGAADKIKIKIKDMLTPGFISVFVGLFLFFSQIQLPYSINNTLSYMSNSITAMAMFLVGAQLGEVNIKGIFMEKYVWENLLIRLVGIPAAVLAGLMIFIPGQPLITEVLVLMFAMPCASSVAILARQYGRDYIRATEYIMTSTILLTVTLPAWTVITENLFNVTG